MLKAQSPCLLVCTGKDCRESKGFQQLLASVADVGGAAAVPCQNLCHGPIAGVVVDGGVRWVSRVRGPKERNAIFHSVDDGRLHKTLRKYEIVRRRGEVRGAKRATFVRSGRRVDAWR